MSLYPDAIRVGDIIRCRRCNHEFLVKLEWLTALCARLFPGRLKPILHGGDLQRLRCTNCGAKGGVATVEGATDETPRTAKPADKKNWAICRQCGGDGGAGSRCPSCGGTGWAQSDS